MQINKISFATPVNFGAKILNEQNIASIEQLRGKFNDIKENGIPVGDCFYKIPQDHNANLTTADKKYTAGLSSWGDNLIISEKLPYNDMKKTVIDTDGNVFYSSSVDEFDIEEIDEKSGCVHEVNKFLEDILPRFLGINKR